MKQDIDTESTFSNLYPMDFFTQNLFYSAETWFTLSGCITRQNNRHLSIENPHAAPAVPVQDVEVRVGYKMWKSEWGARLVLREKCGQFFLMKL
jgi:hypothetical protein